MARQIAERRAERAELAMPREEVARLGAAIWRRWPVAGATRGGRGESADLLMRHAISNRRYA